jgi:predicted amidophosphoribosyltransferase
MPTFKHPCPQCGTFINRDAVACPACGRQDPFTPLRCASCRAPLENPASVACPRCGQPVGAAAVPTPAPARPAAGRQATAPGAIPGWGQPAPAGAPPVAPAPPVPPAPPATPAPPPVAPVSPAASVARADAAAPAVAAAACAACGSPLAPGARFCRDCGTPAA